MNLIKKSAKRQSVIVKEQYECGGQREKDNKKSKVWRPCDTPQVNIEMGNEQQGMGV